MTDTRDHESTWGAPEPYKKEWAEKNSDKVREAVAKENAAQEEHVVEDRPAN